MADWNFDISQAPKGEWIETVEKGGRYGERKVSRYSAPKIILATKCGHVISSKWLPADPSERRPVGRWEFLNPGTEPLAWMPWPQHPNGDSDV